MNGCRFFSFILLIAILSCQQEDPLKYKDADLPVGERVDDLLARMTPEEKFWQLFMIPYDPEGSMERFEHGIFGFQIAAKGRSGHEAGQLLDYSGGIALETRSRGIRQILSPVLNIARDVRWGRTEETCGEDSFLTTVMGLSFISQFEKTA